MLKAMLNMKKTNAKVVAKARKTQLKSAGRGRQIDSTHDSTRERQNNRRRKNRVLLLLLLASVALFYLLAILKRL